MKERVSMIFIGWWCLVTKLCPALVTSGSTAHWAPLFIVFPRQEYWRGLPFPYSDDLPDPGIEPTSTAWQVDSLPGNAHWSTIHP